MGIFEELKEKIDGQNKRIVFPEGTDPRIIKAARRLEDDGFLTPILLGEKDKIEEVAKEEEISVDGLEIIHPATADDYEEAVKAMIERRKGKNTEEECREMMKDNNYYGTMMVYLDKADGLVSGAVGSTADTVRPALQIIKTREGVKLISGAMIMIGADDERLVFSDIAINITLEPEQLAEVAIETARTAKMFGIDPKVAMLSFSTKGSAHHELQEKMAKATEIAKEKAPDLCLDGELQFDAAYVPSVGKKKAPGSEVAGKANVFIFPDLQAGNIGYKIAQRLGGFDAIGPILQGMKKPVSDLSRGCSEDDVYKLAIITAAQSAEQD